MWRQHVAVGGTHGKRNAHIISGKAGFPDDQIKLPVAEAIVDRTGGQPYLTQLYGFWLVASHKLDCFDVTSINSMGAVVDDC